MRFSLQSVARCACTPRQEEVAEIANSLYERRTDFPARNRPVFKRLDTGRDYLHARRRRLLICATERSPSSDLSLLATAAAAWLADRIARGPGGEGRAAKPAAKPWTAPRTPDGKPDLSGLLRRRHDDARGAARRRRPPGAHAPGSGGDGKVRGRAAGQERRADQRRPRRAAGRRREHDPQVVPGISREDSAAAWSAATTTSGSPAA